MNFEKTTVEQLRKILVKHGGLTEDDAFAIKGKSNLVCKIKELSLEVVEEGQEPDPDLVLEPVAGELPENENWTVPEGVDKIDVEIPIASGPETQSYQPRPKCVYDEDWHDYVMSQFRQDELYNGNPTVSGLRRVAELVLGEIVFSGPRQIFPCLTTESNGHADNGRSAVVYEIRIAWRAGLPEYIVLDNVLPERTFVAVADAWDGNVVANDKIDFRALNLTIAETRAEGRALRKALYLRGVVAAEEVSNPETPAVPVVTEWDANEPASAQQLSSIQLLCTRLNEDYNKVVVGGKLTRQEAADILKNLNSKQTKE